MKTSRGGRGGVGVLLVLVDLVDLVDANIVAERLTGKIIFAKKSAGERNCGRCCCS